MADSNPFGDMGADHEQREIELLAQDRDTVREGKI